MELVIPALFRSQRLMDRVIASYVGRPAAGGDANPLFVGVANAGTRLSGKAPFEERLIAIVEVEHMGAKGGADRTGVSPIDAPKGK